jgi:hypothetical protein
VNALVVGARTTPGLELARQLAAAGARVIVADAYPGAAAAWSNAVVAAARVPSPRLRPEAFLDAVRDLVRRHEIDLLVPCGEEAFWLALASDRWPRSWSGRFPALGEWHDKLRFSQRVAELGVPGTRAPGPGALHEERIAKRRRSRFGRGLRVLAPGEPPPTDPDLVVQERVRGRELCSLGVARDGELVGYVVYEPMLRIPLGPAYVIAPVAGPPPLRDLTAALAATAGWTGPIALDVVVEEDGTAVPLECNPRWTLGVHLLDGLGGILLGEVGTVSERPGPVAIRSALWTLGLADAVRTGRWSPGSGPCVAPATCGGTRPTPRRGCTSSTGCPTCSP